MQQKEETTTGRKARKRTKWRGSQKGKETFPPKEQNGGEDEKRTETFSPKVVVRIHVYGYPPPVSARSFSCSTSSFVANRPFTRGLTIAIRLRQAYRTVVG